MDMSIEILRYIFIKIFPKYSKKSLPQYSDYCAYGITFGKMFDTNPKAWEIVDGMLYLNLDNKVLKKVVAE